MNDALVGDDAEGPPFAVEWTDANPFEPTRIRVEASDVLGTSPADVIELAPFEFVEATGVSSVLLEATVVDKPTIASSALTRPHSASRRRQPQTIDLVSSNRCR